MLARKAPPVPTARLLCCAREGNSGMQLRKSTGKPREQVNEYKNALLWPYLARRA